MARLYVNENVPEAVVVELRGIGDDVVTMRECGQSGRAVPDEEVLEQAISSGRALLTLNRRHFVRLHHEHPNHRGIIVCTFDPDFSALARRVHDAACSRDDLSGQLLRVNRPA
jgi:hypothetical protein